MRLFLYLDISAGGVFAQGNALNGRKNPPHIVFPASLSIVLFSIGGIIKAAFVEILVSQRTGRQTEHHASVISCRLAMGALRRTLAMPLRQEGSDLYTSLVAITS